MVSTAYFTGIQLMVILFDFMNLIEVGGSTHDRQAWDLALYICDCTFEK